MEKIKELFSSILANGIFEVIKAITFIIIVPTLSGIGVSILADIYTAVQPYRIPLIVLVVIVVLVLIICIYHTYPKDILFFLL